MGNPKIITLNEVDDVICAQENGIPLLTSNHARTWANEKVAIQWIRRIAERNKEDIQVIKVNGEILNVICEKRKERVKVKHHWQKANVLSLGDCLGKYNKLVCSNCGKMVRHYYLKNRHFPEEYEYCDMHENKDQL